MGRRGPTRSELKRQAILDAAVDEFRESGFVATSMDRIADRARVSKRTVYNHFASKEGLFTAIITLLFERSRADVDLPYDPAAPIRAQLEMLAETELAMVTDPNFIGLARTLMAEAIRSPELVRRVWPEIEDRDCGIEEWVRAAAADGRLEVDDPEFASEQFIALIKVFAFWPQVIGHNAAPDAGRRRTIVDETVSMFLARYGAGD